jgi:hypothetical protein
VLLTVYSVCAVAVATEINYVLSVVASSLAAAVLCDSTQ